MTLINELVETLASGLVEEQEAAVSADELAPDAPRNWETWLETMFPEFFVGEYAFYQAEFWQWAWAIRRGVRPQPFIGIWPRGYGKSTSIEAMCAMLGATRRRRYGLYVCETQDQADDHVQTVASLMTTPQIAKYYPSFANRAVSKFGTSLGWRRQRVRAANGFILDGLGLDKARRGAKIEEARPDFIIFDDIDGESDTLLTVSKKIKSLTRKIIPAGTASSAIVGMQNLVHPDSIFSKLAEGEADFLMDRHVSGPHPAILDLKAEIIDGKWVITKGESTWPYMTIEKVEDVINLSGLSAFKVECQHETVEVEGLVFKDFVNSAVNGNLVSDQHGAQFDYDLPFELGVDDGYVDERAILFIQKQPKEIIVFDEIYESKQLEEAHVKAILIKCAEYYCQAKDKKFDDVWPKDKRLKLSEVAKHLRKQGVKFPEVAAVSHEAVQLRRRLQSSDIPARNWMKTAVSKGSTRIEAIKVTRQLICDDKKVRVIKVHSRCRNLIKEITRTYRYPEGRKSVNEKPLDGNDHACEALENWCWLRMRRLVQKGG